MKTKKTLIFTIALTLGATAVSPAYSQDQTQQPGLNAGVVVDLRYQDGIRSFSEFEEGFNLGHSELTLFGNFSEKWRGVFTGVMEVGEETETDVEEAFIEGVGLAPGLNLRIGRFLSNFGYLNPRHFHEDDFSDRPAVYRTFLGGHYFDNGVAADFLAPTEKYLSFSVEAFDGEDFAAADTPDSELDTVNVWGGSVNFGGDSGNSSSWQFGFSFLQNSNGMVTPASLAAHEEHGHDDEHGEDHHDEDHDEDHHDDDHLELAADEHDHDDEEHGHSHGPEVTGEMMYGVDFTWKWAPDGNFKNRNLTLSAEYIWLDDLFDSTVAMAPGAPDTLDGWYLSAAYQFAPQWTFGLRYGEVETYHGDVHIDEGMLEGGYEVETTKETDVSLAWHPSHETVIRTTYTRESLRGPDESNDENIIVFQFLKSFGAHRAHSY